MTTKALLQVGTVQGAGGSLLFPSFKPLSLKGTEL